MRWQDLCCHNLVLDGGHLRRPLAGARGAAVLLLDGPEGAVGRRALGDAVVPPDALKRTGLKLDKETDIRTYVN